MQFVLSFMNFCVFSSIFCVQTDFCWPVIYLFFISLQGWVGVIDKHVIISLIIKEKFAFVINCF